MRLLALLCVAAAASPAAAQDLPPDALRAYSVGQAAHMLMYAAPCFPREGGDAALRQMLEEAQARIQGQAEQQRAFDLGRQRASLQQRHIPQSDPVACRQIRDALLHFLRN